MQNSTKHKIVIAKHGGGELANQLWNYISIYAYGLESGRKVLNPSFYEYHYGFELLKDESLCTKLLSRLFVNSKSRRGHPWKKLWRRIYSLYPHILKIASTGSIFSSENTDNTVYYLPPTESENEQKASASVYFFGWLFRNPDGLKKYRAELVEAFAPKEFIRKNAEALTNPLRAQKKHLIGVHIRRGDYKTFKGGSFWIPDVRMKQVVEEHIREKGWDKSDTALLIVSDGATDENVWKEFTSKISKEDALTDLYALSRTDAIVGSNSSFGHYASWYGNIPHIVATVEEIDWSYYRGKHEYFANKHASLVQF